MQLGSELFFMTTALGLEMNVRTMGVSAMSSVMN